MLVSLSFSDRCNVRRSRELVEWKVLGWIMLKETKVLTPITQNFVLVWLSYTCWVSVHKVKLFLSFWYWNLLSTILWYDPRWRRSKILSFPLVDSVSHCSKSQWMAGSTLKFLVIHTRGNIVSSLMLVVQICKRILKCQCVSMYTSVSIISLTSFFIFQLHVVSVAASIGCSC